VLACDGVVVLQGPNGKREVGIDEFWTGYRQTARKPDELALEVRLPAPEAGTVSAFQRVTRVTEDIAKINVAVQLSLEGNTCRNARLAMGCVAPTPIRLQQSEALLKDRQLDANLYNELLESVRSEISPIDDVRSSADYRREVAGVLLKRTIQAACGSL
jgi:carbon-monoxide dehydrogenase medium subunit